MSEKPNPIPAQNGQPAKPAGAAVIRRIEAAEESSRDRLMKKLLPAWVSSGAFNLGIILFGFLIAYFFSSPAPVHSESIITSTAEKQEEEKPVDLTNEDKGIDSNLQAATDSTREADMNSDGAVTTDPIGAVGETNDTQAFAPPGVGAPDTTNPGAVGTEGAYQGGAGGANGSNFGNFNGRSGATKSKLLGIGGGNDASERAVALGLAWLARQQRPDGSWMYDGTAKEDVIAATGMSLLPFLAAGQTHKTGKYQKNVAQGLQFLVRNLPVSGPSSGKFNSRSGHYMYSHGIATIALCEAYGMTRDKAMLFGPAQAAINYIHKAQAGDGSWGYQAGTPGDTSIVGWQIQALKAAKLSKDIVVDDNVVNNALRFLDKVGSGPESQKSVYGYTAPNGRPGTSLTAVGLLCRYYNGWGPGNGAIVTGVEGLMPRAPKKSSGTLGDMYFYYYATQMMHFFGGKEWKTWNEGAMVNNKPDGGMRDLLVDLQKGVKEGANFGSWDPDGNWIGNNCGRLGTTCMCLLTLEVYYRHLPLFKRDNGGEKIIDKG